MPNILTKIFNRKESATNQPIPERRAFGTSAGVLVDAESAMHVSAFYRGVVYVSSQLAKLDWNIKNKDFEVLENDPIYYLLNVQPNREMTAFSMKTAMIQTAIIKGNAYAEIERDIFGKVIAIWPLPSGAMSLERSYNGELFYRCRGGFANGPAMDVAIDLENVLHIKNFHTLDGYNGQGVASYAETTLGISIGGDKMASGIFANGGLPSGVLTTPTRISEEGLARLKEGWKSQFSKNKAGSVAILEEGMKFEALNMDPSVLQFLESRKFGVLEIARFLGVPPTKLYDISSATYSNQEQSNLEILTDTLDAWSTNIELEVDVKLLKGRFAGRFCEVDLQAANRADSSTRTTNYVKLQQAGALTANEIRKAEGRAPYPGGDQYFIAQNNLTPIDRLNDVIDATIASKTQPKERDVTSNSDEEKETQKKLSVAALNFLEKK